MCELIYFFICESLLRQKIARLDQARLEPSQQMRSLLFSKIFPKVYISHTAIIHNRLESWATL